MGKRHREFKESSKGMRIDKSLSSYMRFKREEERLRRKCVKYDLACQSRVVDGRNMRGWANTSTEGFLERHDKIYPEMEWIFD